MTEPKKREVTLSMGALSLPIGKQLEDQGFMVLPSIVNKYERWKKEILSLWFGEIITDKQKDVCINRMLKKLARDIEEHRDYPEVHK